jgi:hypothetical protein
MSNPESLLPKGTKHVKAKGRKIGRHARRPHKYDGRHALAVAQAQVAAHGRHTDCQACSDLAMAVTKAHNQAGPKLRKHKKVRLVLAMKEALTRGKRGAASPAE